MQRPRTSRFAGVQLLYFVVAGVLLVAEVQTIEVQESITSPDLKGHTDSTEDPKPREASDKTVPIQVDRTTSASERGSTSGTSPTTLRGTMADTPPLPSGPSAVTEESSSVPSALEIEVEESTDVAETDGGLVQTADSALTHQSTDQPAGPVNPGADKVTPRDLAPVSHLEAINEHLNEVDDDLPVEKKESSRMWRTTMQPSAVRSAGEQSPSLVSLKASTKASAPTLPSSSVTFPTKALEPSSATPIVTSPDAVSEVSSVTSTAPFPDTSTMKSTTSTSATSTVTSPATSLATGVASSSVTSSVTSSAIFIEQTKGTTQTAPPFDPYRNWDSDSQERERELEERAREQNHPADDIEDTKVHEVNHYVPEDEQDETEATAGTRSVARWYLLLLAGNSTTVRLRQKDFAKYLKLNLAARLSVEYNDLRVNRVEFKPLLMVNVTIFSRPKDNEEVPLHMLADTNATLLELSGEEYHVVRFITIPSEHQEALASSFQSESYTSSVGTANRHVDMGVAVYFAIAAALGSILLAVFVVGLCRYLRKMAAEVSWRPWRRYKPIVFPRWTLHAPHSLPLQHRLHADHIASCAPRPAPRPDDLRHQQPVWTTTGDDAVPVQKILAPEPPRRLVFTPETGKAHLVECRPPPIVCGDSEPSMADTLLRGPSPNTPTTPAAPARPNSRLSLFGSQSEQHLVQPDRTRLGRPSNNKKRLQPQSRHPLDVRIGSSRPTVVGLDNPNYMLQ